jgi:hypothetical protein
MLGRSRPVSSSLPEVDCQMAQSMLDSSKIHLMNHACMLAGSASMRGIQPPKGKQRPDRAVPRRNNSCQAFRCLFPFTPKLLHGICALLVQHVLLMNNIGSSSLAALTNFFTFIFFYTRSFRESSQCEAHISLVSHSAWKPGSRPSHRCRASS